MVASSQLTPGMTIKVDSKLYRIDSCVKVTVPKGSPFIKTKLRDLQSAKVVEKNFKPNQDVKEIQLQERKMEFLYQEGKGYLFLDISSLEQILVPGSIVGEKINYLKEATDLKAVAYGNMIFSVELPQYMELMVVNIDSFDEEAKSSTTSRIAELETGAKIEVPPFIEVGDIIKVDTESEEYIQRV